jgi:predicted nucleotidyltransferase
MAKRVVPVCGKLAHRMMTGTLDGVLETLRNHQSELRPLAVSHAAGFGSVARREAHPDSDIDVLVDLDTDQPIGIFEFARLKIYVNEILDGSGDVVNRRTLKLRHRDGILHDAVYAF